VLMLSLGVLGIVVELYNPGLIFPATLGGICLIIGFYGLQVLPVNWAGVLLMLLGHVIGGLAVFGASILAAGAAVMIAGMSGVRHVRKLVSQQVSQRGYQVVQLRRGEYDYD